ASLLLGSPRRLFAPSLPTHTSAPTLARCGRPCAPVRRRRVVSILRARQPQRRIQSDPSQLPRTKAIRQTARSHKPRATLPQARRLSELRPLAPPARIHFLETPPTPCGSRSLASYA